LANWQVVVILLGLELIEAQFGLVSRAGLVNPLQVSGNLRPPLPGRVVQSVPDHVHDELHAGVRKHRLVCLGEALQTVDTGN